MLRNVSEVLGRREGVGGGKESEPFMPIRSGDDRRRLVPEALVQVLTILLLELDEAPSHVRTELLSLRTRLCRLYGVPDPRAPANSSSVAQDLAEDDGLPITE